MRRARETGINEAENMVNWTPKKWDERLYVFGLKTSLSYIRKVCYIIIIIIRLISTRRSSKTCFWILVIFFFFFGFSLLTETYARACIIGGRALYLWITMWVELALGAMWYHVRLAIVINIITTKFQYKNNNNKMILRISSYTRGIGNKIWAGLSLFLSA